MKPLKGLFAIGALRERLMVLSLQARHGISPKMPVFLQERLRKRCPHILESCVNRKNQSWAEVYIIDKAQDKLTESLIKEIHRILKSGTSGSQKSWFNVGGFKKLPNEVGTEMI